MSNQRDVLVFSKRFAGGVRKVAGILENVGRRPVLVSAEPEDINRDACAAHIVIDWEHDDLDRFVAAVDAAGVEPTAVVNFVEPLLAWQLQVARHYGLPGGEPGREALLSKTLVRAEMARLGLSGIAFASGPAGAFDITTVTSYPVIVKPARDSGGSRLVRRCDGPDRLAAQLRDMAEAAEDTAEVIVEQYLDGREFSVDGPLLGGRFEPVLTVEKTEHDDVRHHDAGLRITPPPSSYVRRAALDLAERISVLCRELDMGEGWLHVEGRAAADGSAELIEINPRPGGGLHRSATLRTCGIDPFDVSVMAALAEAPAMEASRDEPGGEFLALLPFEPDRLGTLVRATPLEELLRLPSVVDGYQTTGYRVSSLEQENFFAEVMLSAESVDGLREAADKVRAAFDFTFE
ncbi:acetyl-CoA carboxylase biotin carboxylase subunit family protein [Streptomyces caelestis]|uniref:ATP-grasp domain-containing protein n=1 Tax=Streptomyces caelestis TaxID=36816 RepID=UPI00380D6507